MSDIDWTSLEHAYGAATDLPEFLQTLATGDTPECLAALRELRVRVFHQGSIYPATGPVLSALVRGLSAERPDPTVASAMFLFDVLARVGPSLPAARASGTASPLLACDEAFREAVPILEGLLDADDVLVRAWALHLLSWMPEPVEGLAAGALAVLDGDPHPVLAITAALATAIDPAVEPQCAERLRTWLGEGGDRRRVAALVLALLRGHPQRPDAIGDETYGALLELARGPVWGHWDGAPARQQGFYADLADNLLRCGYHRAETSLPALLDLLDACPDRQVEPVVLATLKLWYHAHPYDGDPTHSDLTALQVEVLERLARTARAWEMPYGLAITLGQLGLPLDAAGVLAFLGMSAEGVAPGVRITAVDGEVVTLETELSPAEVVAELEKRKP